MPFELGLAVARQKMERHHVWFVFESVSRRLSKSLSDLDGTDPHIHDGTIQGIFRELNNALVRSTHRPNIQQMGAIYRGIRDASPQIQAAAGAKSLFEARVFQRARGLSPEPRSVAHSFSEGIISPMSNLAFGTARLVGSVFGPL
jgi:hypothetical protein